MAFRCSIESFTFFLVTSNIALLVASSICEKTGNAHGSIYPIDSKVILVVNNRVFARARQISQCRSEKINSNQNAFISFMQHEYSKEMQQVRR